MENVKKILSVILAVFMMVTAAPLEGLVDFSWPDFSIKASAVETTGKCGENATYSFDSTTGEVVISGEGAIYNNFSDFRGDEVKSIVINEGITGIGRNAFYNCTGLKSVKIPSTVTSIGDYAFVSCSALTDITMVEGVTTVGYSAFAGCNSLKEITFPDTVTVIGDNTFGYCETLETVGMSDSLTAVPYRMFYSCKMLENVEIPRSVTEIGAYAFTYCENLKNIVIPDSVTSIGEGAFEWCKSLESVTLSKNLTNISNYLFYNCSSLKDITLYDGITVIGERAFTDCAFESVDIPDTVTTIDSQVFYLCGNLKNVKLSANLESIGDYAFAYTPIESIHIPAKLNSLGIGFFSSVSNLSEITVDEENEFFTVEDGTLFNKDKTTLLFLTEKNISSYTVPDGVVELGDYVFSNCSQLNRVELPDSLEIIGEYAFNWCICLKEINIPSSVREIRDGAFSYCYGIKDLVLPDGITEIAPYLIVGCSALETLTVPNSVKSIGEGAFQVDNLKYIYYTGTKAQWNAIEISDSMNRGLDYAELVIICSHDGGNIIEKEAVAEKCMEDGHTAGSFCNDCEVWLTGDIIPMTGHTDEDKDNVCEVCSEQHSEIFLDVPLTVEGADDYMQYIKFTAFDSGVYSLEAKSVSDYDLYGYGITDANKKSITDHHSTCTAELIEGNIYYLYVYMSSEAVAEVKLTCLEMYCKHNATTRHDAVAQTCTSHGYTAGVFCDDCQTWVSGHDIIPRHTDINADGICDICESHICDIYTGEIKKIEICDEDSVTFKFIPEASGKYIFRNYDSDWDWETTGYIYDSEMNVIAYGDYSIDENGDLVHRFNISGVMEKGETYYLVVKYDCPDDYSEYPKISEQQVTVELAERYCDHEETAEVEAKDPECLLPGNTSGTVCVLCGTLITSEEIPATGHNDSNGDGVCETCGQYASDIVPGVPLRVDTTEEIYLKFIPEFSGVYTFTANSDHCDNYAKLTDEDDSWSKSNDDGGKGLNFSITRTLKKGEVCYLSVGCYDVEEFDEGCVFDVIVTLDEKFCEHVNTETVGATEGNCTVDSFTEGERCTECGEWVSGHEITETAHHTDENNDTVCDVCGMLASDIIFGQVKYIGYNGEEKTVIRFIPSETGGYEFAIKDWMDTNSPKDYELTDSEGKTLFDDYIAGDDSGYNIERAELTAGQVYYFSIMDSNEETGFASIELRDFCPHENSVSYDKEEPGCEDNGREAGVYCEDCDRWVTGGNWLNSTGHNYSEWCVDVASTCTTDGSLSRVCLNCSDTETKILHAMHTDENNDFVCDKCGSEIEIFAQGTEDKIWWKLFNDGELIVGGVGSTGSEYYDDDEDYGNRDYAFYGYRDYVKSLRVMNGITYFGYDFRNCYQLEKVTMAGSVKEINDDTFWNCTLLKTVVLSEGTEEIGSGAFGGCTALKTVVVPSTVIYWDYSATFYKCTSLETVTILAKDYVNFDESEFEGCTSLKTINAVLPEGNSYSLTRFAENNPDVTINYNYAPDHLHSFELAAITEGTCSEDGKAYFLCDCGISYKEIVYSKHTDENLDRKCDICGESTLIRSGDCSADGSQVEWSLYDNGDLIISGTGGMSEFYGGGMWGVPDYFDHRIRNIIIEDGVTSIGEEAFRDFNNVESVSLCGTLTSIGYRAFENCAGLTELIIPDSVTELSTYAFRNCCNISELKLSDNITVLDDSVFEGCTSLKNIILPAKLEEIYTNSSHTFEGCINIESYDISEDNENFEVVDGVLYNKDVTTVITCPFAKKNIEIPETVNELGIFCFMNCAFETVDLPEISKITWGAFKGSDITEIEIPASAEKIERWAFTDCDKLEAINVPGNIKTIDAHAFDGCSSAKTIELGEGIRSIFGCVFIGCSSVKKIEFPDSLVSLACDGDSYGTALFDGCTSLEEVVFPEGVRETGYSWFGGFMGGPCPNLKKIVFGDEAVITSAAHTGFPEKTTEAAEGLVYIGKTVVDAQEESTDAPFRVKNGTVSIASDISKAVIDTKGNAKEISLPDSVKFVMGDALGEAWLGQQNDGMIYLGNVAYKYKGSMPANTDFVIREGTASVSDYAFSTDYGEYRRENLRSVIIPEGVSIIGSYAFGNCTNLSSVSLPDTLEYIEDGAFCSTAIESVVIPSSVERVYDSAFSQCKNLKNVIISDGVKMIGDYGMGWYYKRGVFGDCTALETISLPESVELIWAYAFNGCTALESIEILNENCEIYDSADTIPENTVIYGKEDSTAEAYAKKYNRQFVVCAEESHTHEYDETVTVQPTCSKKGEKKLVCKICARTITESIPALGHTEITDAAVAATCTTEGKTEGKHCSVCGEVFVAQKTVSATGHKLTTLKAVAATCTKTGLTEGKKCSVCGTVTVAQKTVNKKAHTNITSVTKATLSKDGKTVTKCTVCGAVSATTVINKVKTVKLSKTTFTYNGKTQTPSVTVKDSKGNTLKKDVDYTVTYPKKRKSIGKYTVTVPLKGKYSGTKKLTFEIVPAKAALSKLTAGSKSLTATWKTVSGVTGYEVQYSTSKKFTKKTTKTVTIKKAKTKKTTIKKLKKGKKYYVKVRAYKTVSGKKLYGAWSSVKNVKVK